MELQRNKPFPFPRDQGSLIWDSSLKVGSASP